LTAILLVFPFLFQLVFCDGLQTIKSLDGILRDPRGAPFGHDFSQQSIHILHSSIPQAEQREVFQPSPDGVRRIILATNIAETSVTIPDVVYVVDTGRVKESRYDSSRHMSSLVSAWVGTSNISQRAGRAGRHRSGEYYGVLTKARFNSLSTNALVEMKRSDLSNVVMHIKVSFVFLRAR
jgi:HrpA-like RNA helicase